MSDTTTVPLYHVTVTYQEPLADGTNVATTQFSFDCWESAFMFAAAARLRKNVIEAKMPELVGTIFRTQAAALQNLDFWVGNT